MGDFDIQDVTVTAKCCSHIKLLSNDDNTPLIDVMESKEYYDVVLVAGLVLGNDIVLQFDAYDDLGNIDTDILTVILK